MSEPFVGEIRMFGGNFAPRGWALCQGQLLPVSQNDALFSLLGTIYGGDGRTTFALPDMRGRIPIHRGRGPGLSDRRLGSKGGAESVTLTTNELPAHGHTFNAVSALATSTAVQKDRTFAKAGQQLYVEDEDRVGMTSGSITPTGGGQPHSNMMPTQCVNYIIALFGIYPSRS
ncbi:MAG: tail fiber protein [Pseudomonadota bacterium]